MEKNISVFGSAFISRDEDLFGEIEKVGRSLAENNYVVCSGGYSGTMEAISGGAVKSKGKAVGIIVESWGSKPNQYLTEIVRMPNLMERITELIALGDAYVIFKGGTGTLVELSIALELMNKKAMKEKPIIFYSSYWKLVIETLKNDSLKVASLLERNARFVNNPEEVIKVLKEFRV